VDQIRALVLCRLPGWVPGRRVLRRVRRSMRPLG
jgi:hypothetical protein